MSRYVMFEARCRGSKESCDKFFTVLCNYERYADDLYEIAEGGNEENYTRAVGGACSSSVFVSMMDTELNLQIVSKLLNLEIEVFGGDPGDGDVFEHYHYASGECIDAFFLPYYIPDEDYFEEYEVSDEDRTKYVFDEMNGSYCINPQYVPKAHWNEAEELECEFSVPMP